MLHIKKGLKILHFIPFLSTGRIKLNIRLITVRKHP